ncbi:MAG TPA: LemA family protein [Ramlibacter sp.]|uniref:LemA family protein n=1 Tax=Ramlibacter sp. TaxID=1917967 RepID=UPI002D042328|nr:LemA family protein [Ramlibacter sp.]HVZ44162.1 LemA family protein [Ramlibacter sp.]
MEPASSSSWIGWAAGALLLFWGIGAYNRLVRMRADCNAAFAALESLLTREVELVNACMPADEESHPPSQFDGVSAFWSGLHGAAMQFAASLAAARQKPLEADRIAALGAAQEVLEMAWERAERDDAHDLAGPRLPRDITAERVQVAAQVQAAIAKFNEAIARYNEAIAQFPASLLAWLFGFQAGRGLRAK